MKKLFVAIFCILAFAVAAGAAMIQTPFSNMSAASGAVKYSPAFNVTGYKLKTIHTTGQTLASNNAVPVYKNMSGTVVAQCGPTSSGPWVTCTDRSYAQTAASVTTNTTFTWDDAATYVRLKWTSGTVGGKLKAWLFAQ